MIVLKYKNTIVIKNQLIAGNKKRLWKGPVLNYDCAIQ